MFTELLECNTRFRYKGKFASPHVYRRGRIRQHQYDPSQEETSQWLPFLLFAWKKVLAWDSSHRWDRFPWIMHRRSARRKWRRIKISYLVDQRAFPSETLSTMNKIDFHKSSKEWKSDRLRVRRAPSSLWVTPRRGPWAQGTVLGMKTDKRKQLGPLYTSPTSTNGRSERSRAPAWHLEK